MILTVLHDRRENSRAGAENHAQQEEGRKGKGGWLVENVTSLAKRRRSYSKVGGGMCFTVGDDDGGGGDSGECINYRVYPWW